MLKKIKKKKTLFLIFIFLIAFFLRFFKLGEIPYGFYQDESAIGYNAYSIMLTGKDEHGQDFPLYFKSFGDYKLPIYIYTTALSIKTFGLTEFAVRLPSAIFGFLTVIAFYFFVKSILKDTRLAFVSTTLVSINPWHIHYSRATFEVSISLFLFVLGGLILHKAFAKEKSGLFLLGTLCFVANIYTYNLTRLLSPLLFLLFILFFKEKLKVVSKKEQILTILSSAILLIPFSTTLFGSAGLQSARGTLIFSSAQVQALLLEFRSYLVPLPEILVKPLFNMFFLTIWQYLQNIANYFSPTFFFISGSSHGNHGIGNVGQFYLFEFPLIVFGVTWAIRKKLRWAKLLLPWLAIVIILAALTRESPHATRSFFLIVPFEVFSALGLLTFFTWVKKQKTYKFLFLSTAVGFVFYNLIFYFLSYYVRFPILYAKSWRSEDKAVALYLKENEDKYDKIIFDKQAGFVYTSLLFYTAYSPSDFQRTVIREEDNLEGFSEVASFGKYEFKDVDWSKDAEENALIVTTPDNRPQAVKVLKTFSYPKRPVVISVGQAINQYPVEETAYVVVQTK